MTKPLGKGKIDGFLGTNPVWGTIEAKVGKVLEAVDANNVPTRYIVGTTRDPSGQPIAGGLFANPMSSDAVGLRVIRNSAGLVTSGGLSLIQSASAQNPIVIDEVRVTANRVLPSTGTSIIPSPWYTSTEIVSARPLDGNGFTVEFEIPSGTSGSVGNVGFFSNNTLVAVGLPLTSSSGSSAKPIATIFRFIMVFDNITNADADKVATTASGTAMSMRDAHWGDRYKGRTDSGFTVNLLGQIVRDTEGQYWRYIGAPASYVHQPGTPLPLETFERVDTGSFSGLDGLDALTPLNTVMERSVTLSQAIADNAPVGTRYRLTDLGDAPYEVVAAPLPTARFDVATLANGNFLVYVKDSSVINLRHFNINYDGNTAGNGLKVQAAFNLAANGTLIFDHLGEATKTVLIDTPVQVSSNTEIVGAGAILLYGSHLNRLDFSDASNVTMTGMEIDGNRNTWTAIPNATVSLRGCSNVKLMNNVIRNGMVAGIGCEAGNSRNTNIKIVDNEISAMGIDVHPNALSGNAVGVLVAAGDEVTVKGNTFTTVHNDAAVKVTDALTTKVNIKRNTIRNANLLGGKIVVSAGRNVVVADNVFHDNPDSQIIVTNAINTKVEGNSIVCQNTQTLVPISVSSPTGGTFKVTENTVEASPQAAFEINADGAGVFTGNTIINSNSVTGNDHAVISTGFRNSMVGGNKFILTPANFTATYIYDFNGTTNADMKYVPDTFEFSLEDFATASKTLYDLTGNTSFIQSEIPLQSAAPTTGYNTAGRFVRNATPATGQPTGWVCTTAGTPGTWEALANL